MRKREGSLVFAWSGGKDSTLGLHRVLRDGLRVTHLLSIYEASSGRIRFHGVRRELVAEQARALGLKLIEEASGRVDPPSGGVGPGEGSGREDRAARPGHVGADREGPETGQGERGEQGEHEKDTAPETTPFERAFLRALDRAKDAGCRGVVFGNIHLEEIRAWYERRVRERGLEHLEPLWGGDPTRLAREFVGLGYRARLVSVMEEAGDPAWVGRELDGALLDEIASRPGVDPCGERGEFHSFAYDGPIFRHRVRFSPGPLLEMEGHRMEDLLPSAG